MSHVSCLRYLAIALLVAATTAGGCEDDPLGDPLADVFGSADLTVILVNGATSGDPIHIFNQVLETFGAENQLAPSGSREYHYGDVDDGDTLTWVAGRNGVVLDTVECTLVLSDSEVDQPITRTVTWSGSALRCGA